MRIALHASSVAPTPYIEALAPALRNMGHEVFVLASHDLTEAISKLTLDLLDTDKAPQRAVCKLVPIVVRVERDGEVRLTSDTKRSVTFYEKDASAHALDYYLQVVEWHQAKKLMRPNIYEDYA